MTLKILCDPYFSQTEYEKLSAYAQAHGKDFGQAVREAVSRFSAKCVPTHAPEDATEAVTKV